MTISKTKFLPLLALMLMLSVFLFAGTTTAYASDGGLTSETLTVDEVWLAGDTLHITVTDDSGESQTLELNLSEYAKSGDEYVTVQATDSEGRTSNSIQFKNPYYVAKSDDISIISPDDGEGESAVPDGNNAFTPDGTGTVLDNATDGDGKEFFTVETADGNVFYLIVDRERTSDNVYLLDAVKESDLVSLATPDDDGVSAIETPAPSEPTEPTEPTPTPELEPEKQGGNMGTIVFVVIAIAVIGGVGYYVKILRPKQLAANDSYDEPEDDFDDDEELDMTDGEEYDE